MPRRVRGFLKRCGVPGSTAKGYRAVWDTGFANYAKKISKVRGPDRPSV